MLNQFSSESGVFQREGTHADRRYVDQLQGTLRLPAGCTEKVYRPQSNPGKYGLYTVCHGTDHGR